MAVALLPVALVALVLLRTRSAAAFGEEGAFHPRALIVGGLTGPAYSTASARWSFELMQRTSAPARTRPSAVRADDPALVQEPFVWLSGRQALQPFTAQEIASLRRFFGLGGILLVDDAGVSDNGNPSPFGRSAREQIARVLPDTMPIALSSDHVLFRTFYIVRRPQGRVEGPASLDAIVRGGAIQVLFTSHDLGGALAHGATGSWEQWVTPGGEAQREYAIRLAVNIAMYTLCSNYKDDQVHAPTLMRRRAATLKP